MYIPRRALYHSTLRLATHPSCSVRLLTTTAKQPPSFSTKTRNFVLGTASIFATVLFLDYYFDSRAAIHKYLLMPVLRGVLDAEDAHRLAIWSAKWGLSASDRVKDDERLAVEVWGRKMANPVGLAAGFDKHGEAIDGLFDIGFGYVEIGSVTPKPQPGNPKPRVFRLPQDRALINRYGFPSDGHRTVALRLRERIRRYIYGTLSHHPKETARLLASSPDGFGTLVDAIGVNRSLYRNKLLGINLGKNKSSDVESVEDYVKGVKELGDYADVLVINVSSPNTPGLRSLQKREKLEKLLREVIKARNTLSKPQPPLLVKISPDLSDEELDDISDVAVATGVDDPNTISETGGLSGPPLKSLALRSLQHVYQRTGNRLPLIGCGGITNGKDAVDYARAGATLIQLYTSFAYDGFGKARQIKDEILRELDGRKWSEVIGEELKVK